MIIRHAGMSWCRRRRVVLLPAVRVRNGRSLNHNDWFGSCHDVVGDVISRGDVSGAL
jgi:hypothetical protein